MIPAASRWVFVLLAVLAGSLLGVRPRRVPEGAVNGLPPPATIPGRPSPTPSPPLAAEMPFPETASRSSPAPQEGVIRSSLDSEDASGSPDRAEPAVARASSAANAVATRGEDRSRAWRDLKRNVEAGRKLAETEPLSVERRRELLARAVEWARGLADHPPPRAERDAIRQELQRLLSRLLRDADLP